jgi:hypothetical protein
LSKELYKELYRWFCAWEETYIITCDDFIKTLKMKGIQVSLSDIKEFWETDDKVTKDYLVCVDSSLYRKIRQLK